MDPPINYCSYRKKSNGYKPKLDVKRRRKKFFSILRILIVNLETNIKIVGDIL